MKTSSSFRKVSYPSNNRRRYKKGNQNVAQSHNFKINQFRSCKFFPSNDTISGLYLINNTQP
jgi:hypothetical protein